MNKMIKFQNQEEDLKILRSMAAIALKSEKYEGYNEATILNIFLTAKSLGIDPMIALNGGFNVVKGKINMGAHFMTALARRAGHSIKVIEMTVDKCIVIAQRKDNQDSLKYEMTMAEANLAGLTGKENWRKNPKQMLYCACIRNVFRILFSDIAIAYDADEMNVDHSEELTYSQVEEAIALPFSETLQIEEEPLSPFDQLKAQLEAEDIPTEFLENWVSSRAKIQNEEPDTVIKYCLNPSLFPQFKVAFAKWVNKRSELIVA